MYCKSPHLHWVHLLMSCRPQHIVALNCETLTSHKITISFSCIDLHYFIAQLAFRKFSIEYYSYRPAAFFDVMAVHEIVRTNRRHVREQLHRSLNTIGFHINSFWIWSPLPGNCWIKTVRIIKLFDITCKLLIFNEAFIT